MENAGWLNANNRRGRIKVGEHDIEVAGVHDSHIARDRYDEVAGPQIRPLTCDSACCTRLSRRCWTCSPTTGSTCCWPAIRMAGRSGCLAPGRWSLTAASRDPWPAGCTVTRHGRWASRAMAARLGWPRYLSLRPGALLLPAGGYAAHAGARDQLDFSGGQRGVAQLGSALRSGRRGRRFKSGHPDQVRGLFLVMRDGPPSCRASGGRHGGAPTIRSPCRGRQPQGARSAASSRNPRGREGPGRRAAAPRPAPGDLLERIDQAAEGTTRTAWLLGLAARELDGTGRAPAPVAADVRDASRTDPARTLATGTPSPGVYCATPKCWETDTAKYGLRDLPLCHACAAAACGHEYRRPLRDLPPAWRNAKPVTA